MTALVASSRLVVAVRLQETLVEMRQAGTVDRLDDVVAEVDRRHELDAIVPEPLHQTDEREDPGHRAAGPIPEQGLCLLLAREELIGDDLGPEHVCGMACSRELRSPCLDGRQAVGRARREVPPGPIEPSVEQATVVVQALSKRGIGEQLVPGVGE